jgi:hypothetical protein
MNGLKKTLSIMLCVAMIASGSFMAFAEGETNPQQDVTVVEGEGKAETTETTSGAEEEKKEENKDEDKQQSEALLAAIGALNSLPLFDSLTEDTDADALLAQVQAARKAYDALTEEEKLLVEEGKLNNLLDLEFFFENRPSNTPVDAPVSEVVETLDAVEAAEAGTQEKPTVVTNANELKEALAAGGWIKLNADITTQEAFEIAQKTTLLMGNHSISTTEKNTPVLKIMAEAVLENGTISADTNGVEVTGNGDLKVNGTKISATRNHAILMTGGSATINSGSMTGGFSGIALMGGESLTVNGGTMNGYWYGIAGNGTNDGTTINISGGTIEGKNSCAIYHPQEGDLTIEGGNLTGLTGVQYCGAGQLTISGGTIRGTAPYTQFPSKPAEQGDGSADDGAAVSIISRGNGYQSEGSTIEVSITGGNLISDNNAAVTSYRLKKVNGKWETNDATKVDNYLTDLTIGSGASLKGSDAKGTLELDAKVEKTTVTIENGATFVPSKGVDQYLGDDQAVGEDGSVGDLQTNGAAKIGNEVYRTFEEALKAAQSGDTIVLQKDVSTGAVTLPAGVTLDGGNHVITCNTEIANGAFITATGDNVTIKNATVNVDGKAKHGIQFYCVKGGKLENVNVMGGKFTAVIVNGAEVSINGGNLSTNGYAVVEYAMGNGVTEVPKLTMNNVTTPNTDKPLVYMDKATIDRIKENTPELKDATTEQVIEYLKKDNLTGNNIKDMQVGENGMIIVPAPSTPVDPPVVPEKPNSNSGNTGSSSTVQQMEEREKPDPADKKAMEEYNFWMQVKSKIRATAEGKTLRITVKEGIEYMPASVMQTLYECKVGITLYWDGVTIEIPVGKAQPKQALRVYWTKTKLMDLYNA